MSSGTPGQPRAAATLLAAIPVGILATGLLLAGPAGGGSVVVDPVTQIGLVEAQQAPSAALPPAAPTAPGGGSRPRPDDAWLAAVAGRTGIGARALSAYASADLRLAAEDPGCQLSWTTLAGIGYVESRHGTIGGRTLGRDGRPGTAIIGVALSGAGTVARIADTDQGALDGDVQFDRAVGPMQFIPATWRRWGGDGDRDGLADPQDIDDAGYSAARYLCASGGVLDTADGWGRAVLSYNQSDAYLRSVLAATNSYASRSRS